MLSPGQYCKLSKILLEAKADAELSLKRDSKRLGESGCPKEVDRQFEVICADNVLELVAEVSRVEDIERFKEEAELSLLAEVEELRQTNIDLRELVAALCGGRQLVLVVAVARLAVVCNAVLVDVASAATREDAVRPRRRQLQDRRNLEAPRQVEDA